jgi:hypothetical protein
MKWALKSRVVWDCNSKIGISYFLRLEYRRDTNSTQVLRRKGEKNFEKRVKRTFNCHERNLIREVRYSLCDWSQQRVLSLLAEPNRLNDT